MAISLNEWLLDICCWNAIVLVFIIDSDTAASEGEALRTTAGPHHHCNNSRCQQKTEESQGDRSVCHALDQRLAFLFLACLLHGEFGSRGNCPARAGWSKCSGRGSRDCCRRGSCICSSWRGRHCCRRGSCKCGSWRGRHCRNWSNCTTRRSCNRSCGYCCSWGNCATRTGRCRSRRDDWSNCSARANRCRSRRDDWSNCATRASWCRSRRDDWSNCSARASWGRSWNWSCRSAWTWLQSSVVGDGKFTRIF
mmetsp:Transcript_4572/g.7403  ORF Transcript_4572/g.7403 Transcript_4572/m.7403 type:complete len:252 (+) Transcript_4572:315-1070(+)